MFPKDIPGQVEEYNNSSDEEILFARVQEKCCNNPMETGYVGEMLAKRTMRENRRLCEYNT